MRRGVFLLFLCSFFTLCDAKPPALTPRDTKSKIQEILRAHVSYQALDTQIIQRALSNYLEEVDPIKTYLLSTEIEPLQNPSPETLQNILQGIEKEDFSFFFLFHDAFLTTIERRALLEKEIAIAPMPIDVHASEFKSLTWLDSTEALKERLLRIKALQMHTATKLSSEDQAKLEQKLDKRRKHREEELRGKNTEERKQIVLAYVLKSISSALDSQTAYFTPTEATQFMMQVQQKLYGIGAQLRDDLNGLSIIRLIDGGPAALSGKLRLSDKIIAVNQEPIIGLDISEAVEMIRGKQGTSVCLTILRTSEGEKEDTFTIDIVRDEVVLKETRLETSSYPVGDGVIGIFHLFSFYDDRKNSSAQDLYQAIAEMKKNASLKGVILDLRNNAGGLLSQAVAVTGLFIDKGVVVSVKHNTGEIEHLRNLENHKAWNGPLLILTNRASASASEIVAQTLQEYGVALVTGDTETFGKGTFQTFTLESSHYGRVNPKGEFKVTRGRYYTVSGKSPQLIGVKADIVIPGPLSALEIGEKYAKFPVSSDSIEPSFQDDFLDVSPINKLEITKAYQKGKQEIQQTYLPYLEILRANSSQRILSNKNYQNFLTDLALKAHETAEDSLEDTELFYGNNDLQLTETLHIMTDFLFLEQNAYLEKRASSY